MSAGLAALAQRRTTIDKAQAVFRGASLADLIVRAYRVQPYQLSGLDRIKNARFDIDAKLPEGASTDSVPEMLQALLADRFKLKLRREDHEFSVYALVVGKSGAKLTPKRADYDAKTANGLVPETMGGYATLLSRAMDRPVVDRTEIQGEYMVSLRAIARAFLTRRLEDGGKNLPDEAAEALGPDAFALVRQMGLELEPRKLSLPLLVVESVEKTPTEN